jgi:hypothetical protein
MQPKNKNRFPASKEKFLLLFFKPIAMRYFLLFITAFFFVSVTDGAVIPSSKNPVQHPVANLYIPYEFVSKLKIKEAEKLLGHKMKLKENLAFKAFQWKIKKGYYPIKSKETDGRGKTAMILGIIAIASLIIPYFSIASIPCAILAIIFGNQAKKINPNDGQAKAGVILGWVAIGLLILALILVVAILANAGFWFG